jgi:hypothetical protein
LRRVARDSFFKSEQSNTAGLKSDINSRERDPEREAAVVSTSSSSRSAVSSKDVEGYVGYASLPNQIYRKSVKNGFEFTLMVVGKFLLEFLSRVKSEQFTQMVSLLKLI